MKQRYVNILLLLCFVFSHTSCVYLPFVDYVIISDFSPYAYKPAISGSQTDSLKIGVQGTVWLPKNSRAKRLNTFFLDISPSVELNKYGGDTIFLTMKKTTIYTNLMDNTHLFPLDNLENTGNDNVKDEIQWKIIQNTIILPDNMERRLMFNYPEERQLLHPSYPISIFFEEARTYSGKRVNPINIRLSL